MGQQLGYKERCKRFDLATKGSNICIWDWIDINEKEQWWSPYFYETLGYEQDEIKATIDNFKMLLHPDDRDRVLNAMEEHFASQEPILLEYRLQTKSGDYKWFEGSAQAEFNSRGEPIRIAGNIIDIDSRKKAEMEVQREQNLLRTIIDNIPVNVYVKDLKGRKILANKSEYELWGFDEEEEMIGKTDADLSEEIATISEAQDKKVLETGEPIIEKDIYTEINDRNYVLLISKLPIKDDQGEIIGLVGISVDITERKKMEDELRKRNNQLESLNEATNKIYSVIGHDLKTPLTSILGLTDLMLMEMKDKGEKGEVGQNLKVIRKSAIRMSELLRDLLSWARVQTGDISINRERFSIQEPIQKAIDLLSLSAEQKGVGISCNSDEQFDVVGDKQMIATIMRNFLSNAVKFSNSGDVIHMDIELGEDYWSVGVRDEGIGMSEETLAGLFHAEEHPNKKGTNDEKGSGIGLQLSKELAEMHGGDILVDSELGKGAIFTLEIPRSLDRESSEAVGQPVN